MHTATTSTLPALTRHDLDAVEHAQKTLNLWGYDNPLMPRRLSISIELARCLGFEREVRTRIAA